MAGTRQHILISGTGRSGTTFLIHLLTALGFDTGFKAKSPKIDSNCHAGMEWDIRDPKAPFIVKNPWACEYLDSVLDSNVVRVKHLIIPVRDLYAAAESRRDVMRRAESGSVDQGFDVPGGLWGTLEPEKQEQALAERFYKLLWTAARYSVPVTVLDFPRIIRDPEYLRKRLIPVFGWHKLRKKRFNRTFSLICCPELVHEFKP